MAREPQRAAQPHHLNAHVMPVERALLARAETLERQSKETDGGNANYLFVAAEFRSLAVELHYW
jgi:hypothetical protein